MSDTGELHNKRLCHEKAHGALIRHRAEEIWGWSSPAGRRRAARRAELLATWARLEAGQRVLELGCGTGLFSKKLQREGLYLTAIDISLDLLSDAVRENKTVGFIQADAHRLPFADNTFNAVVGSSVLHHLQVGLVLREIRRVVQPGGRIAFAEPNMMNPQILAQKNIPPLKRWLGDTPDETAFFRWSLAKQLADAGYSEIQVFCHDFLHPAVPPQAIGVVELLGRCFERAPLIREIAGSLLISAVVSKEP